MLQQEPFYADNVVVPRFVHIGEDYIAPDFQPVLAPYDGQIVACLWTYN